MSTTTISPNMGRNIILFAAAMAKTPGLSESSCPVRSPPPPEPPLLAVARIVQDTLAAGGELDVWDGERFAPLSQATVLVDQGALTLNQTLYQLTQAIFYRSPLSAFDHLLLAVTIPPATSERWLLIAAHLSPLGNDSGVRWLDRHFRRIQAGQGTVQDFHHELNGLASLLRQGEPPASGTAPAPGGK